MEPVLEKINNSLSKKRIDSFEFNSSLDTSGSLIQYFRNSFEYSENASYYVSLVSFECSSLFPNISEVNNKFYYNDGSDKVINLETGMYGPNDISEAITQIIGNDNIKINLIESTGKCLLTLKNNVKVDFTKENNFKDILGFESKIIDKTQHSKNQASILKTQKIYIYCDIVSGSIFNGKESSILYSFANKYKYGSVVALIPNPRQEKLLSKKTFNSITFNFKNENNEAIDFQGSTITLSLEIRQV